MKVVIQRVRQASVLIDGLVYSHINEGMLILVGIAEDDGAEDIDYLCKKIVGLRIFDDNQGVMNLSVKEVNGQILAVSQFTLMASTKKGNRPSYIKAAHPDISKPLFEEFKKQLALALENPVFSGVFGADMEISLVNNGPVTIQIDSKQK